MRETDKGRMEAKEGGERRERGRGSTGSILHDNIKFSLEGNVTWGTKHTIQYILLYYRTVPLKSI